jgi:hypothetical protein
MKTASLPTKTCPRCNGEGTVNSHVEYLGSPGTCFKCDGRGKLVLSIDQKRLKDLKEKQDHVVVIGKKIKGQDWHLPPFTIIGDDYAYNWTDALKNRSVEELREEYRKLGKMMDDIENAAPQWRALS